LSNCNATYRATDTARPCLLDVTDIKAVTIANCHFALDDARSSTCGAIRFANRIESLTISDSSIETNRSVTDWSCCIITGLKMLTIERSRLVSVYGSCLRTPSNRP